MYAAPAIAVTVSALSPSQAQRGHLAVDEAVLAKVVVECVAPPPAKVVIHSVALVPSAATDAAEGDGGKGGGGGGPLLRATEGTPTEVDAKDSEMAMGSAFEALFSFCPLRGGQRREAISLGEIHVRWSRSDGAAVAEAAAAAVHAASSSSSSSSVDAARTPALRAQLVTPLPPVLVLPSAFGLRWELPTEGHVGELLTMRLHVTNRTREMRALRLTYSENDAFLFCGYKLFHFRLPPAFSQVLSFNLVPVKTGAAPLPLPKLLCVTTNSELMDVGAKHRVFVRPSAPDGVVPEVA